MCACVCLDYTQNLAHECKGYSDVAWCVCVCVRVCVCVCVRAVFSTCHLPGECLRSRPGPEEREAGAAARGLLAPSPGGAARAAAGEARTPAAGRLAPPPPTRRVRHVERIIVVGRH